MVNQVYFSLLYIGVIVFINYRNLKQEFSLQNNVCAQYCTLFIVEKLQKTMLNQNVGNDVATWLFLWFVLPLFKLNVYLECMQAKSPPPPPPKVYDRGGIQTKAEKSTQNLYIKLSLTKSDFRKDYQLYYIVQKEYLLQAGLNTYNFSFLIAGWKVSVHQKDFIKSQSIQSPAPTEAIALATDNTVVTASQNSNLEAQKTTNKLDHS